MSDKEIHKNSLKVSNYIKKILPLIGLILLIFLIFEIGLDKIIDTILKISPIFIFIAILITIPRLLIKNYQWQKLLKIQKIKISYYKSLKIYLISYFYGCITPGYLGCLVNIPYLKEETKEPSGKLFINILFLSFFNSVSRLIVVIIGAVLLIDKLPDVLKYAAIFLIINVLFFLYFIKRERGERTLLFFIRILIPKKLKFYFINFVNSFYKDFPQLKKLIIPIILWIPLWFLYSSQIYIIGLSIGIEIPFLFFILIYPITDLVSSIPISAGGLGIREAAAIFILGIFSVPAEKALVLSLAGYLLADLLTGSYGILISATEAKYKDTLFRIKLQKLKYIINQENHK